MPECRTEPASKGAVGNDGRDAATTARTLQFVQVQEEQKRRKFEIMTEAPTPQLEFDCIQGRKAASPGVDDDPLDLTRHNKVFRTEQAGSTLVVTPLGDSSQFLYSDIRTEANKVRRLLEGGCFVNLVVDFGSAPSCDTIMLKVVVALLRLVSNRGGRAALLRQRKDANRPKVDEASGSMAIVSGTQRGPSWHRCQSWQVNRPRIQRRLSGQ